MKNPAEKRIGVIGLGLMKTAITQRLLEHGNDALGLVIIWFAPDTHSAKL